MQLIAPAAVLVNRLGDILYLHGRTGMYLEPAPGEAGINNILKMAREGLRRDLTTALHKASVDKEIVHRFGLRVKTNGDFTKVNLVVSPVATGPTLATEGFLFLVVLQEALPSTPEQAQPAAVESTPATAGADAEVDVRIEALRQELRAKEEYLQTANEELETSNEELQSTNEELETSKEELQSVNEELATVNTELQAKVIDLSRVNNDMNNLLAGTGIGTVFIDHQLRILRFTPAATRIINLVASDVGRPVGHLASNLVGYDRLLADAQEVLNTLIPFEREVQSHDGRWYTMRIQPYRTLDNIIEGAVITFVDITELKDAQVSLLRLAVVVRDAHDPVTVYDLEGRILAWNPAATRVYGWSGAEALTMNICDAVTPDQRARAKLRMEQLGRGEILEPFHSQRLTKEGTVVEVRITATALVNENGEIYAISTTEQSEGLNSDGPGKG